MDGKYTAKTQTKEGGEGGGRDGGRERLEGLGWAVNGRDLIAAGQVGAAARRDGDGPCGDGLDGESNLTAARALDEWSRYVASGPWPGYDQVRLLEALVA